MRCSLAAALALLVAAAAAPAANPTILFTTNSFRSPEGGERFEEVGLWFDFEQGEEKSAWPPRINSFRLGVTFEDADVGVTFTPPRLPVDPPGNGEFALPGATLVDEGSTPRIIRVSAALPDPADSVPLTWDSVFVQFQVRVPHDYPRDHFTIVFDPEFSRLTGPDGDLDWEPSGVVYDAALYLPEPAAGLLPVAAAAVLLPRRRTTFVGDRVAGKRRWRSLRATKIAHQTTAALPAPPRVAIPAMS